MKNLQAVKLFLIVILCASYIVSFSNFGVLAYEKVVKQASSFPKNTTIAQSDVSGKNEEEALQLLLADQQEWVSKTVISIQYKEFEDRFDVTLFDFSLEETVQEAVPGQANGCVVTVAEEHMEEIQFIVGTEAELDKNKLEQTLLSLAGQLKKGMHTVQLEDFLKEAQLEDEVISEASVTNVEQTGQIQKWVDEFPMIEIEPYARFSLFDFLEEHGEQSLSDDALSTVATALYEVVLATNFNIIERHISREFPSYAQEGLEAKINREKNMDLVIMNPNDQTYTVQSTVQDNALHVSLVGPLFLYTYAPVVSNRETVERKTIVQFDPLIPNGQSRIETEGQDGFLVKVFREIIDGNGIFHSQELVSEDYYRPIHQIELRSLTEQEVPQVEDPVQPAEDVDVTDTKQEEKSNNETENNKDALREEEELVH